MPYFTTEQIDTTAHRVITAYLKLPTQEKQPPSAIDPELLAKELLGLTVEYHHLSSEGDVHGLTVFGETIVSIYDDPKHPEDCFLDSKTILIESGVRRRGELRPGSRLLIASKGMGPLRKSSRILLCRGRVRKRLSNFQRHPRLLSHRYGCFNL